MRSSQASPDFLSPSCRRNRRVTCLLGSGLSDNAACAKSVGLAIREARWLCRGGSRKFKGGVGGSELDAVWVITSFPSTPRAPGPPRQEKPWRKVTLCPFSRLGDTFNLRDWTRRGVCSVIADADDGAVPSARSLLGGLALWATLSIFLGGAATAQGQAQVSDDVVHVTAGLEVGLVSGQISTDGIPGFGFNLVVEKGSFGGVASYRGTGSGCGSRAGGDGLSDCDSVSILDAGLRYTVPLESRMRPYFDASHRGMPQGGARHGGLQEARSGESLSRWAFGGRAGCQVLRERRGFVYRSSTISRPRGSGLHHANSDHRCPSDAGTGSALLVGVRRSRRRDNLHISVIDMWKRIVLATSE